MDETHSRDSNSPRNENREDYDGESGEGGEKGDTGLELTESDREGEETREGQDNSYHQNHSERRSDDDNPTAAKETRRGADDNHEELAVISNSALDLQERLRITLELFRKEQTSLRSVELKDYQRVDELESLVRESRVVFEDYTCQVGRLYECMRGIRESIGDLSDTLSHKLTNEGLVNWLNGPPAAPADKSKVADEKGYLAKAAESRAILARVNEDIAKAEANVAKLEQEAIEAASSAELAAREAEAAAKAAEQAREAAERKRKSDEEARRKAEEAERKKEEEMRRKKEEEERVRRDNMTISGTPEEQERLRQEAERRDPKNWPNFVYSVEPGDSELPVGCVMRAIAGSAERDDLRVQRLEQLDGALTLNDNEELVSNIIQLSQTSDRDIQYEEPVSVALPHCASRNVPSREPVIKQLCNDGVWLELTTKDVIFEDIKEYKFVEARLTSLDVTLAVVTRVKRETHVIHRRGGKVTPSVDIRICFNFKSATFKNPTNLSVEIQPVELSAVTDLKYRNPNDCSDLLASSPITSFSLPNNKLPKPVVLTIPVPPNPSKARRPVTAAVDRDTKHSSGGSATKPRPTSAAIIMSSQMKKEEAPEDKLFLLVKAEKSDQWSVRANVCLVQPKNKDVVNMELDSPLLGRFIIVRTKPDVVTQQVEAMVGLLEASLSERVCQLLVRQRADDLAAIKLQCTSLAKFERHQKRLTEEGYGSGPNPSPEFILHEGQVLTLRFRGNIRESDDRDLSLVFNSNIKSAVEFFVTEIDKFAQKSLDCYRGFVQAFTKTSYVKDKAITNTGYSSKGQQQQQQQQAMTQSDAEVMLCELLISLPKPEPEAPKPIVTRAPVKFMTDDLVDNQFLHRLATDIGEEWKRLAQYLSVRRMRIQAIMRNNVNSDNVEAVYEMLLTWAKKVPRSLNKVDVLCSALMAVGRADLVEEMRDKEKDFRQERARSARDSVLRKAFIRVAQNAHLISDWAKFGRQLGLSDDVISSIEHQTSGMRDTCFQGLQQWRDECGDEATLKNLLNALRKCRYHRVAEIVEHGI